MIDPRRPDYSSTPVAPGRPRFAYAPADPSAPHATSGPVVTVVTPFYNTGPVFHETAASLLGQSLQSFEWLIVNDGSNNQESLDVLDRYRALAHRDPRIRIIDHKANHGLSAARNTGFRTARAPLVFMLDSDDLIEPTTLEKCALFLDCNPAFAFVKGKTIGFGGLEYLWEGGFHDRAAILDRNPITATAMVRRAVFDHVGGFDETIRGGLEDRDFWVRAAALGHWGATIHEHLDWYRRRHGADARDFWPNLASKDRRGEFRQRLERLHPELFADPSRHFPAPAGATHGPDAEIKERTGFSNPLDKHRRRLLMVVPWLRMGGADTFNLDLVRGLAQSGWEVTIATTLPWHPWLPEFTRLTPDVFLMDHLGPRPDYPRILRHLIDSRRPDVVMISNSEAGYLSLPFLRSVCPGPAYVDLNHMEEMEWKNGGHPRQGLGMSEQLDLNITVSEHLRAWMVERGADPARVEACHINVDTSRFRPDPVARRRRRRELNIDDGTVVILHPARLTAQKQPMVLLETIRRLAAHRPLGSARMVALIAGDGDMRAEMDAFIARHHLHEHARMLGPVALADMPALYNAADILFLPSMIEGIALTLYEAMATGLPVVGAGVGGQAELVVEGTGFLLPPNTDKAAEAAAYVQVLRRLIAEPGLRQRTGAAAAAHIAAHHTQDRMWTRMQELFALAEHNRRTRPRPALPARLARELAEAGIEWLRTRDEVGELKILQQQALESRSHAQRRDHHHRAATRLALAHIEGSRAWRLIQGVKGTALYRLWAKARYGPDWRNQIDVKLPPHDRLARIRASRTYKLLATMKRLPPVKLVSRARHGPGYRGGIPELIRND